ncbi:MAG TPA: M56 family metallopeptidase, partial [Bryobacteraceae bacterium]|nr:M56 family metallopeptidase [Bryobacteraceae bacterium]
HLVWSAAVVGVLVLPLISLFSPAVEIPIAAGAVRRMQLTVYATEPAAAARNAAPGVPLLMIWAGVAGALIARLACGLARVAAVTWTGAAADELAADVARGMGLRRQVRVRLSERVSMPTTWGLLRPAILLPATAREWTCDRLRIVVRHELGHVRRADWFTQLLAHIACAVYWFNPLVWFAARQIRKERELACDDGVLAGGIQGSEYAQHLVEIARGAAVLNEQFTMGVAMAQRSSLETRVLAMLDAGARREGVTRKLFAGAAMLTAAVVMPLASMKAPAQGSNGKVSGIVTDPSGGLIAGARVVLVNTEGRNKELTTTNGTGEYQFASVPPGRYTIEVRRAGFQLYTQSGIQVTGGSAVVQNAVLQVGKITETINIVGEGKAVRPAAMQNGRMRVGGALQASRMIHMERPVYPASAKARGVEGTVLMRAVIGRDGNILNLEVLNTDIDADLVTAAKDAVSKWRYEPTLLNGEPVEVVTEIEVNFTLAK